MKIVIGGGTGFVGHAVLEELTAPSASKSREVVVLTRSAVRAAHLAERFGVRLAEYDPAGSKPTPSLLGALEGADALLHLAGEQVVGARLTEQRKRAVVASRVESTTLLVRALQMLDSPPPVFVCASAVGYYGDSPPDRVLAEDAPPGHDFLAEVCKAWEEAALRAEDAGVRVTRARIGVVLGRGGGALEKMALPVRMFVGGRLGDGRQMVSWIHKRDVARALLFCLEGQLAGPVNLTAPSPASNAELTRAIGRRLGRPTPLFVPKAALSLVFGEGAETLTTGQRVVPKRLLEAGFTFLFPDLEQALAEAL